MIRVYNDARTVIETHEHKRGVRGGLSHHIRDFGIRDTAIFGPEIGILGLISNAVFAFLFWQWWRTRCNRT